MAGSSGKGICGSIPENDPVSGRHVHLAGVHADPGGLRLYRDPCHSRP